LLRAAHAGHAEAQFSIGEFYDVGQGVAHKPDVATYWHARAAGQGHTQGQYRLGNRLAFGVGSPIVPLEAFYWMQAAAEQDHIEAQFMLGQFYRDGVGVEKDLEQALYWYERSAEQGLADAMLNVSGILMSPELRQQASASADDIVALQWLILAADAGNPCANVLLREIQSTATASDDGEMARKLDSARSSAEDWRRRFLATGREISTLPEMSAPEH
jgi:TPR repeat protein